MAATDAAASASGSATTLVALGGLRDRALELSRLTAVHAFPAADQKELLKNFQNKQCTDAVKAKDFAGFVKLILSHNDAVFAAGNDETTSGYFTLIFSFLRDISSTEQHDAVVQDIISLLSSTQDSAALRLNILADLYNTLAPSDARFELFVGIIRYSVAAQLVELLAPFFAPAAAAGAKSLNKKQHRTLLQEISSALDAAGLTDEAQQYRIAFLESLQGADAAVLAAAQGDAVKAATGYFKAPVVSQKSNLPVLDAVVALKESSEYARVYQLLNIFAAGRVSDFVAFVGTGDNKAWMEALGVNVEGSERTVRLLTLASLASTSNQISYATVAEALQVPESDAEAWVVNAVGRGLLDAKCSQETKTVTVSRSIAREFGDVQWTALAGKLNAWRDNIDGVLTRMRSARMESSL